MRSLIAWSSVQKPEPTPQPLPPRDKGIPQLDQPADQQAKPPADRHNQQSPAQSFTGFILRYGNEYILKASDDATYRLIGQIGIDRYDNKKVVIVGTLDNTSAQLHVLAIELVS